MTSYQRLLTMLLILIIPATALAGGGAGHQTSFADTYKYWPNFFVYLILFYMLLKSPLKNFWASRREGIEKGVNAGEKELKQAQEQLEQAKQKLTSLEQEIAQIKSNIADDTKRESQKLVADAKDRAQRIVEQAKTSIEAESKTAEFALRQELADHVIAKAEERLRSELSADSDRPLRQAAVQEIKSLLQ